MQSPLDKRSTLLRCELANGLPAWTCPATCGYFIQGNDYWKWLRKLPQFPFVQESTEGHQFSVEDTDRILISPTSGRLMTKYRVGKGFVFRIDYDASTGDFWLDRDEYETLEEHGLHDELHLICDAEYQRKLRAEDHAASRRTRLLEMLHEDGVATVETFAEWMNNHDEPELAHAYLLELLDIREH